MKKITISLLAIFLAIFIIGAGCKKEISPAEKETEKDLAKPPISKDIEKPKSEEYLKLEKTLESKLASLGTPEKEALPKLASMGIFWVRPHPGNAIWNEIERAPGYYDWELFDRDVKRAHSLGIHPLLTIWPYTEWDQEKCHTDLPSTPDPFGGILPEHKGIPCDWQSYQKFLTALVERYDADGQDDMPGLVYPVNYFEIGNEPEMKGYNTFFQGTPSDYALLLKKSAETIRKADPQAKILHAGIASSAGFSEDFWNGVFSQEGISDYFDIANIHDLAGTDDGNVEFIKRLLEKNNISDKPIWVTEFRLFGGPGKEEIRDMDELKSRISSTFSAGAQKIFLLLPPPQEIDQELANTIKEVVKR